MPRVAAILAFSALLLLSCGYLPSVSAQIRERETARKFDEFGKIGHCDLTARLDNLAIGVQTTPGAKAQIISYAPPSVGEALLEQIKDYLINGPGLAAKRIITTYGGRNSDLTQPKIELWILPPNASLVAPVKQETNVETFKGLFVDARAVEDFGVYIEGEMGPGIGRTIDASFADMLDQQKNATGYVVVYSGEDATPGAWQRIAQDKIGHLTKFNLEPGRLKMIFGGHQKETRLHLWILPKDAPPPIPDAGPELPLARTVNAGDFSAYDLGDEQNQTNLFARLKQIMHAQKTVRTFLVVRLERPIPEEPTVNEPETESVENEPPSEAVQEREPADLTKLVEKWRVELANTHKIGPDRFIVVFTTAREFESSNLSVWIVPKGKALPDPNEEEDP